MPMSPARLSEYIQVYDVDLPSSCVIVDAKEEPLGLGMLGVRPARAWITRLGVIASKRKAGVGRLIMNSLIQSAERNKIDTIWLEVIKGNAPAHAMFKRFGFKQTRELLVVRRPPNFTSHQTEQLDNYIHRITPINNDIALELLAERRSRPNWLNETESMQNLENLEALMVECYGDACGWASFDVGKFQLSRVVVEVLSGDPIKMSAAILRAIHRHYATKDTVIENIAADDPKWDGFQMHGYFDSFRRIENGTIRFKQFTKRNRYDSGYYF